MAKKIKVLIAKLGLDGHDLGARFMARLMRDAGMEVIYTGRHQSPDQVVMAAEQEDVDVIGLSFLSGAHLGLTQKLVQKLTSSGLEGAFFVVVGGTIPEEDVPKLKELGVGGVFPSGTLPQEAIQFIKDRLETS